MKQMTQIFLEGESPTLKETKTIYNEHAIQFHENSMSELAESMSILNSIQTHIATEMKIL